MTGTSARLALSVAAASLLALPAFSQSNNWKLDGERSSAQILFVADPHGSGNSMAGDTQSARVRFRPESVALMADGKLKLTGALTVTRVISAVEMDANEAYSGPVALGRKSVEATRQVSIILPGPAADSHDAQRAAFIDVTTELKVNAAEFPELAEEFMSSERPAAAQDQNCAAPADASEAYAGTLCTGSASESRPITRIAGSFGEDYPGAVTESAQPANVVTLALHLRLAQQDEQLSAQTGR